VILCLVTDRRRLAPGAGDAEAIAELVVQAHRAAVAGVDLIQIRERDLEARALADLAERIKAVTRGTDTRVVVNDRLDVALATRVDGVHLRGDSIPVRAARSIAPAGFLVGRSIHSASELGAVGDADYVIAGTVFTTPSKPHADGLLGMSGLREIASRSRAPVLAIGGVTLESLPSIAATGAAGAAAIGLFVGEAAADEAVLRERIAAARRSFDTAHGRP
jgi:thiamine-phosphate pyrophosphorylase